MKLLTKLNCYKGCCLARWLINSWGNSDCDWRRVDEDHPLFFDVSKMLADSLVAANSTFLN